MDEIFSIFLDSDDEPSENKNEDNGHSRDPQIAQLTASIVNDLQIEPSHHSPSVVKLPTEIILYIFDFALRSLPDISLMEYHWLSDKDQTSTPFILGAVCHCWRAIVWSTPILWSTMVIHLSQATLSKTRSTLAKDWLDRSGQLPLSIRIVIGPFRSKSLAVKTDLKFLARIITSYSSRWCHFEIVSICHIPIAPFFRPRNPDAPMLESLRLQMHIDPSDAREFVTGLVTCPRLQEVDLPYMSSTPLSYINFSWNTVTHLSLPTVSTKEIVELLPQTPLLVHAQLSSTGGLGSHSHSPTILPFLKSLRAGGHNIFGCMTCPALDELICNGIGEYFDIKYILPFLARSNQISSFSLRNFQFIRNSTWGLISLLQAMPSVNKLVVSQITTSSSSSKVLRIPEILGMIQSSQSNSFERPGFLAHLETFEYTGPAVDFADVHLPTIISPDPVQRSLQSVTLALDSEIHMTNNAVSFFLGLMERGVKVDILVESQNILPSSINYYRNSSLSDWDFDLDISPDIF